MFVAGLLAGVMLGAIGGYALRGSLRAPLGSKHGPERVLTSDLSLEKAFLFAPSAPPAFGTLGPGSRVFVDWRKGDAAYISFETVVRHEELERISVVASEQESDPRAGGL